ncbi:MULTISPECIES: protein DpdD [Stutzerimonas stutzeri subgroup]|uniref:protein DpdD n=1 Tax=Stutzerimonas stutzeri subgroup TaxID=578833 RepID=UPI002898AA98|nr:MULTISPECIES: protein DpdD [Stutzerimonas stutzeri subgroup]
MSATTALSELSWVKTFFSGCNHLNWESLDTQTAPDKVLANVMPWLKKLTISGYDGPVVLPLYEADGRITWYAMAVDDRRFAQMVDEITGFIGPSYSDFRGEWAQLNLNIVPECALAERFGPRVIRFAAVQASDQPHIENALTLYLSVLARQPEITNRTRRPFGKIRSDFDLALLAGNADGAQTFLEEMLASGRVNAEQRKCMEIRLLAGLGHGETLAKNPTLIASISDISLPPQTLVDVVAALYETFIEPIESTSDFQTVVETFKRHFIKPFGGLFRDRKGIRHPKILRAFLLSELAAKEPSALRCQSLLDVYPENADGYNIALTWCEKLSGTTPQPEANQKEAWLDEAKQAIANDDYETASARCFELLPLAWAYSALLRCALEIRTKDLTRRVLEAISSASESTLANLTDKDHLRLEKLKGASHLASSNAKSGWVEWAESVLENPRTAPTVAELQAMATKWSVDEYANDTLICEKIATLLAEASGAAQDRFRDAFPVLVDFFENGSGRPRAFRPIYSMLIKFLAWSGALSSDELEICAQLINALLMTAPSKVEYIDAVEDLQEILKANASPVHFDWGLNLAEFFSQYPAPDQGAAKLRLFLDVVEMLRAAPHRVSVAQRDLLIVLAYDYDCPGLLETFPAIGSSSLPSSTENVTYSGLIGIYTLTEGAGQRAKEILERMYPKAVVELNSDAVSTDRLVALAKAADIFVFAWKSSKHQAYFCIKEARQGQDIVLPIGKGSASILASVLDKITSHTML